MATRLYEVVAFVGVAAGATVALPHSINVRGRAWIPDRVQLDVASSNAGFVVVSVTLTTVTVRNDGLALANANVLLELWHTELRVFGSNATLALTPNPFVTGGGSGGGGGTLQGVQVFTYTATGAEGSDFFVPLPAARPNDLYQLKWSLAGVTAIFAADFPNQAGADRTTTQFRMVTSAAVQAGDVIEFVVHNP